MISNELYGYIERLSNLLRNDSRSSGAEFGLQPIQLEVLHYLSICNRYSDTPMAVTEYLGQTKGTVSQTLKLLEKKGLVTKQTDSKDKRITHLNVSSAGKKALKILIPSPIIERACEQLTEPSQTQIATALKELLLAMQRSNDMKTFGVCSTCHYNRKNDDGSFFCNLTQETLSIEDTTLICKEHQDVS